jgi:hypothetical protein
MALRIFMVCGCPELPFENWSVRRVGDRRSGNGDVEPRDTRNTGKGKQPRGLSYGSQFVSIHSAHGVPRGANLECGGTARPGGRRHHFPTSDHSGAAPAVRDWRRTRRGLVAAWWCRNCLGPGYSLPLINPWLVGRAFERLRRRSGLTLQARHLRRNRWGERPREPERGDPQAARQEPRPTRGTFVGSIAISKSL